MPETGEPWNYIETPEEHVRATEGLQNQDEDMNKKVKETETLNKQMSKKKSTEVKNAEPKGVAQWSNYDDK